MGTASPARPTLVLIYNADSGLFNGLADIAHKLFSPSTYACQLCALTHGHFGMRREWRAFLSSLDCDLEFLHADEARKSVEFASITLPAIIRRLGPKSGVLLSAGDIASCNGLGDLRARMESAFNRSY